MALNTSKCNILTPLCFKELKKIDKIGFYNFVDIQDLALL